jgi:phosphotransferase system IIB component
MPENLAIILMLIIVVPIILLSLFVFVRIFIKGLKSGRKVEKLDIDTGIILDAFGGKDNITDVVREMSRVTITLKDIELINKDMLMNLGATGILLVGDKVKCNFKEKAEAVEQAIK